MKGKKWTWESLLAEITGPPGKCWEGPWSPQPSGYVSVFFQGRMQRIHRIVYANAIGPIPAGMHVHHACENKRCCNPTHLTAVTPAAHARAHMGETCKYGHPWSGKRHRGQNVCRVCRADASRRWRAKNRHG